MKLKRMTLSQAQNALKEIAKLTPEAADLHLTVAPDTVRGGHVLVSTAKPHISADEWKRLSGILSSTYGVWVRDARSWGGRPHSITLRGKWAREEAHS
tara:strand:- start:2546 stop:2839 length:294 start_codon:yes stop_codon:yes gene_type:complete